jgi:hypothetical protein
LFDYSLFRGIFAEPDNDRVIKYTNTGSFITEWVDGRGDGGFESAGPLAADKSGNVFIADTNS